MIKANKGNELQPNVHIAKPIRADPQDCESAAKQMPPSTPRSKQPMIIRVSTFSQRRKKFKVSYW